MINKKTKYLSLAMSCCLLAGCSSTELMPKNLPNMTKYAAAGTMSFYGSNLKNLRIGYSKDAFKEQVNSKAKIVKSASELKTAVSNAKAGDIIYVKAGDYKLGELNIACAGTSSNYITIKNYPGETPKLIGTSVIIEPSAKYINFEGFLIKDITNVDWGEALIVQGGASYINIRNNEFTNLKAKSGEHGINAIVLYGDSSKSINNVTVQNNYVHDCYTGWSEAITADGNVENCQIIENTVDNTGNIGIDLAGNFSWTGKVGDKTNQARNITVSRNLVMNAQSNYATSAGIYCDGGRDNTISYNVVYNAQCGIELGAEEKGAVVENFYVHNNLIIKSGRSIGVGGYQKTSATHRNSYIYNNTIIAGDGQEENSGITIERTSNLNFFNNIIYGTSKTEFIDNIYGSEINSGNNCWYKSGGSLPSGEINSIFKNPLFVNNTGTLSGDYSLQSNSPCINAGKSVDVGKIDLAGNNRLNGTIDIGAFEYIGNSNTSGSGSSSGGSSSSVGSSSSGSSSSSGGSNVSDKVEEKEEENNNKDENVEENNKEEEENKETEEEKNEEEKTKLKVSRYSVKRKSGGYIVSYKVKGNIENPKDLNQKIIITDSKNKKYTYDLTKLSNDKHYTITYKKGWFSGYTYKIVAKDVLKKGEYKIKVIMHNDNASGETSIKSFTVK